MSTPSPNRLAREKSPYLLQHANNPVDWFPWGEEAFAKARTEQKTNLPFGRLLDLPTGATSWSTSRLSPPPSPRS